MLRPDSHQALVSTKSPGAVFSAGTTSFRVWAPHATSVEVVLEASASGDFNLDSAGDGYFIGSTTALLPGALYRYRLDAGPAYPDPCSYYQPQGPHGPSMLVDPDSYAWSNGHWNGGDLSGQVIYEMHVGTFTDEGTFDAAIAKLDYLQALGITSIELMPIVECPGRWNWGYDGVNLFAPYHVYGDYEACKRFVDAAHRRNIGVILDVVDNHLGPDGNYLHRYSPHYFSERYRNDWGEPFNFDGAFSHGARELVLSNACYWTREFHIDGFRLDAVQSLFDSSLRHIVAELIQHVRAAANGRRMLFIAENEQQRAEQLSPIEAGGFGLDAMWNDDYHHCARVALTGSRDGYFRDYGGTAQEFISGVKRGFLFQGQHYCWQRKARGSPLPHDWNAASCVNFLQNHDQVANTATGIRCSQLTSAGRLRALTALTLLAPQTPMLFMGQEFAASTPFMFFADHKAEIRQSVHEGRREFMRQFRAEASPEAQARIPDPADKQTFMRSKLNWNEARRNEWLHLHRDLIRLRRTDPVIARQHISQLDGAVLRSWAFLLRWWDAAHGDRLLIINLGTELFLDSVPEPLLAPPGGSEWRLVWSSDAVRYGGRGSIAPTGVSSVVGGGSEPKPPRCCARIEAMQTAQTILVSSCTRVSPGVRSRSILNRWPH